MTVTERLMFAVAARRVPCRRRAATMVSRMRSVLLPTRDQSVPLSTPSGRSTACVQTLATGADAGCFFLDATGVTDR